MGQKIILLIAAVAAIGGIATGLTATVKKNATEKELTTLREQLNEQNQPSQAPEKTEAAPLTTLKEVDQLTLETNNIAELQEQLAEREAELARLQAELESLRNNQRPPRQSFQERMAQIKEEDPERYAEMVKRNTERHEQMRYDQASRLATLMDLDTSGMSDEELANHSQLVENLSTLWEKSGEFDPENPPDRETMREVFGTLREIGDLMDQERAYMFKQLGADVGLSGTDAEDFSAYIGEILDTTTMWPPRGNRGGRPGGGN